MRTEMLESWESKNKLFEGTFPDKYQKPRKLCHQLENVMGLWSFVVSSQTSYIEKEKCTVGNGWKNT